MDKELYYGDSFLNETISSIKYSIEMRLEQLNVQNYSLNSLVAHSNSIYLGIVILFH